MTHSGSKSNYRDSNLTLRGRKRRFQSKKIDSCRPNINHQSPKIHNNIPKIDSQISKFQLNTAYAKILSYYKPNNHRKLHWKYAAIWIKNVKNNPKATIMAMVFQNKNKNCPKIHYTNETRKMLWEHVDFGEINSCQKDFINRLFVQMLN